MCPKRLLNVSEKIPPISFKIVLKGVLDAKLLMKNIFKNYFFMKFK
jgi:hypothetical protein